MSPNSRRASGTAAMPRRTRCGVGSAVTSAPSKRTVPARGRSSPRISFIVVDLPLALPPSRLTICPRRTSKFTSKCTWTGP